MGMLKIRRIGNSLGVVLPKEMLQRLRVAEGDRIFFTSAPDGSIRVTPYDPEFERQMEAARKGMAAYRNALRSLAK